MENEWYVLRVDVDVIFPSSMRTPGDQREDEGHVLRVDVYVSFPCQQAGTLQIREKWKNVGYVLLADVDVTMSSMRTPGNQGEDENCRVRVTGRCRWRSGRR